MDGWFIWRGINSADIGVIVEQMPALPRAPRNAKTVQIPGRDGRLTISDDTYDIVPLAFICGTKRDDMEQQYAEWLTGKSELILSTNPSKAYRASIDSDFTFDQVGANYKRFNLQFVAQPFAYEAQQQTVRLIASGLINNPGTRWSTPIITVYGAGTLIVGDYTMVISATDEEPSVTINCELEDCYYGSSNRNSKVSGISAGYPVIAPGMTAVTIGAGITAVEIIGNWRWF